MFEDLKKLQADGCDGCSGTDCGSCDQAPAQEPVTEEKCTHDCGSCPSAGGCGSFDPKSLLEETNEFSKIKKVIAVVSGKGGVGKSLITALLASEMQRRGFNEIGRAHV